jgi:uncharacterized protein (TIGR00251 family)
MQVSIMEWIRETTKGILLPIRVVPRASKNEIQGVHNNALKIRLQAPPVEGKANQALICFLSDVLNLPRVQISIASGKAGRDKVILIKGIAKNALRRQLSL